MRANKVGVLANIVLAVLVISFFAYVVFNMFNPFHTAPRVTVAFGRLILTRHGYTAEVVVNATEPIFLGGVSVGSDFIALSRYITPPSTVVTIPLGSRPTDQITLHFSYGNPITVKLEQSYPSETDLEFFAGEKHLFVAGVLPTEADLFLVPMQEFSAGIVTGRGEGYIVRGVLAEMPAIAKYFTVIDPEASSADELFNKTILIFADTYPDPELLSELLGRGITVVMHVSGNYPGSVRIKVVNGSLVEEKISQNKADLDYFGAHCIISSSENIEITDNTAQMILNTVQLGSTVSRYAIIPTPYCTSKVSETYAKVTGGGIAMAKLTDGTYFISVEDIRASIALAVAGFFSKAAIYHIHLTPFSGIKPLTELSEARNYLITVASSGLFSQVVRIPDYSVSREGTKAYLSILGKGRADVRVLEVTYDGTVLQSTDVVAELPFNRVFELGETAYLIYVNNTPAVAVADELSLTQHPDVRVSYSTICEMFSLTIERLDNNPFPVYAYIDGVPHILFGDSRSYASTTCVPGPHEIVIEDIYGNVLNRYQFTVVHIYEQPPFILGILLAISAVVILVTQALRRKQFIPDEVKVVLYRKRTKYVLERIRPAEMLALIKKIEVTEKSAPLLTSVLDQVYKRYGTWEAVFSSIDVIKKLMKARKLFIVSKYIPFLGDVLTTVSTKSRDDAIRSVFVKSVALACKITGTEWSPPTSSMIRSDVVLADGPKGKKRMIFATFIPKGYGRNEAEVIKDAINRAFMTFLTLRDKRMGDLIVGGFIVIVDDEYALQVNTIIDDILNNKREVAEFYLQDTSGLIELLASGRELVLQHYIITAVPLSLLPVFNVLLKNGAVRLTNKFFRLVARQYFKKDNQSL